LEYASAEGRYAVPRVEDVDAPNRLTMDAMLPKGPAVMIRYLTFGAAFAGDAALKPATD